MVFIISSLYIHSSACVWVSAPIAALHNCIRNGMKRNHFKPRSDDRAVKIASLFIDRILSGTELLRVMALSLHCLHAVVYS